MDEDTLRKENSLIRRTKLCNSLGGMDVPVLTISDFNDKEIPYE